MQSLQTWWTHTCRRKSFGFGGFCPDGGRGGLAERNIRAVVVPLRVDRDLTH